MDVVVVQRRFTRDPRLTKLADESEMRLLQRLNRAQSNTLIFEVPKEMKWCSSCGDWVSHKGFSPDKRNIDGLQAHCKQCRADHARDLRRKQAEAQGREIRVYRKAA